MGGQPALAGRAWFVGFIHVHIAQRSMFIPVPEGQILTRKNIGGKLSTRWGHGVHEH